MADWKVKYNHDNLDNSVRETYCFSFGGQCAGEDPSFEIFLYADDSKIYKVIRNQSDQQKLQTILNMIELVWRVASQIKYW